MYYGDFDPSLVSPFWLTGSTSRRNSETHSWRSRSNGEVIEAVDKITGKLDFTPLYDWEKSARAALEDSKASMISIFVAALSVHDDPLIREALRDTKSTEPLTHAGAVREQVPSDRASSGQANAGSKEVTAPPHLNYLASLNVHTDPGRRCAGLSKLARRMADHLDRLAGISPVPVKSGNRIFIGHGRSPAWRELKDFLADRLGLPWDEFNRVPVAGVWTGDRLGSMLDNAAVAFLICTAEDEHADSSQHARENVIHEAGLFQGRLGFARAIILLEEGCAEFSNVHGLGQIHFPRGNISACFEDVRKVLEREGIIRQPSGSGSRLAP